jgi:hypothetical protein
MALPVTVPNTFAGATASIPLSQLDANFNSLSNAINGIANGVETLANVQVTGGSIDNVTVTNVTISTGNVTVTNVTATQANVTTAQITNFESGNVAITGGTLDNIAASNVTITTGTSDGLNVANATLTSVTLVTSALGTPDSGNLANCTVDGTDSVGFRNAPVNSQTADYDLLSTDSGKTIFHPASDNNARTFTIPSNSNVAFTVGTVITFMNLANTVTIAITSDTMYLAGDGATGSRTLAEYGVASALKANTTAWVISGNGLT